MISGLIRNARALVACALTAVLVGGVATAATDAKNADKVDGFHAVGAGTKPADRGKRLVATNKQGRLPNNIIAKAVNANKLDGIDSTGFLRVDAEIDAATLEGLTTDDLALADDLDGKEDVIANLIQVSADGTPSENGDALIAVADDARGTAEAPTVVRLGPGTFDVGAESAFLANNVSMHGAGREATKIVGTGTGSVISPGANSEIQDLSITKTGGANPVGIQLYGGFPVAVRRVTVTVEDGSSSTTAVAARYGDLTLEDVDARSYSSSGGSGFGLTLDNEADVSIRDSHILGRFGPAPAGIRAGVGSDLNIVGSDVEGRSGDLSSSGIYSFGASGEIIGSTIRANVSHTGWVYGIEMVQPPSGSRKIVVRDSRLEAWRNYQDATQSFAAVARTNTTIHIAQTQLDGGAPSAAGGTIKCVGVYNHNFDGTTCGW